MNSLFRLNWRKKKFYLKINCDMTCDIDIIFIYFRMYYIFQVEDRSIDSLQAKFKQLKKMARQEQSEARRELVQTGNKKLSSRTVESLRETNTLQQLRNRMGPTGTGFRSPHCKQTHL